MSSETWNCKILKNSGKSSFYVRLEISVYVEIEFFVINSVGKKFN